jgi:hypothetical protein
MSKTGLIIAGAGGTVGLALLLTHLAKTGITAGKLDILLEDFSFTTKGVNGLGITIPNITFHAKLKIKNPTGDALIISQPYIRVFYKDPENPIGESPASDTKYTLKAKDNTPIEVFVEFASAKVLPQMPDLLKYMLKRAMGAASTRNVNVEIQVSGNGINQTIKQSVKI